MVAAIGGVALTTPEGRILAIGFVESLGAAGAKRRLDEACAVLAERNGYRGRAAPNREPRLIEPDRLDARRCVRAVLLRVWRTRRYIHNDCRNVIAKTTPVNNFERFHRDEPTRFIQSDLFSGRVNGLGRES